jgi:alpha-1,2-mannosyltransferase
VAYRRDRLFVSGLAIGCLAFKPQFGLIVGVVLLVSREWRVVAGAAATACGQLVVGWLVAGSAVMGQYFATLMKLMVNPQLVQLFPSEVHSLRGFFQLLLPSPALVTVCSIAGTIAALVLAVLSWRSRASVLLRFGQVILLTVLASPHLLSYDLVLLTVPLMALADWSVRSTDHPLRHTTALLLVPLYFAPISSNLARAVHVQLSAVVMVLLAVCVYRKCAGEDGSDMRRARNTN